jgi:hypothetical protein
MANQLEHLVHAGFESNYGTWGYFGGLFWWQRRGFFSSDVVGYVTDDRYTRPTVRGFGTETQNRGRCRVPTLVSLSLDSRP